MIINTENQFKILLEEEMVAYKKPLQAEDIFRIIQTAVNKTTAQYETNKKERKLYYISAEFLLGKMLTCNLINMDLLNEAKAFASKLGYEWKTIQDIEKEPSLGNGGLGRLAACFLDSIASLGLNGDGIGLYYHFGLFQQQLVNHKQTEIPNEWIRDASWFRKKDVSFKIDFPNVTLQPICYEMDVVGTNAHRNTLHLFDIVSVDESIVTEGIAFDKSDIEKNLTLFLYPDDSDENGRLLRIYQQYFMVSCGAQLILHECREAGYDIRKLYEHAVIQINDTHPTMVILELIRLLKLEGITLKEAIHIVEKTCAYTNHTILAEALETWPMAYMRNVVPQLCDIIEALDAIVEERTHSEHMAIIDQNQAVHMAHIDIHFGKSVNGVAALHTQILKESELRAFYELYPDHFNNKTNGITFRRWLYAANEELYVYLSKLCNADVIACPDALNKLLAYRKDPDVLQTLLDIKMKKKRAWCDHIKQKQNIDIDADAIFDTQVKRLHEYKRQQMNALYIIHKYLEIKAGGKPKRPLVFIFGAKAAPAYTIAKDIIHILLCLSDLIDNDPEVSPYMRVCFIENYNITEAELVIPASDISEQISLASKEASGTGNMKFMLNGAITIGTLDGANVEIADAVGEENIYVFGENSDTVIKHYANRDYIAKDYYEQSKSIKVSVDFIVGKQMLEIGDETSLMRFYQELLNKDWFMTLLDFEAYVKCKDRMFQDYEDRLAWAEKMLVNIANSGFFSSDRTILEYDRDIWHVQ